MKQHTTIEKLDTGIFCSLALDSSVSILLLAFGLIASMANVLTKGAIPAGHLIMQRVWVVTQGVGIDECMSGTIIGAFRFPASLITPVEDFEARLLPENTPFFIFARPSICYGNSHFYRNNFLFRIYSHFVMHL